MKLLRSVLAAVVALTMLFGTPAFAAMTPNSFVTPQTPGRGLVALTSSIGQGAYQMLYTAGPNGSRCYSIIASSTDSATHNVQWQLWNGSVAVLNVSLAVGPNAGNPPVSGGGPTQPLLVPSLTAGLPVDQYGNQYIQMSPGDTLRVAYFSALTSGSVLGVYAICSDY